MPKERVEFESIKESWGSEYNLSDGNKIKLKAVMTKIWKLDEKKLDGEAVYTFECQVVQVVEQNNS